MSLQQVRTTIVLALIGVVSLMGAGCGGSKSFTPDDFKKVTKGMTEEQVQEILGKPKETLEALGVKRSFWQVDDKYYSVSFKDGKVEEPMGPTDKNENDLMRGLMKEAGKK